jgi:hypothetical protein
MNPITQNTNRTKAEAVVAAPRIPVGIASDSRDWRGLRDRVADQQDGSRR